MDKYIIEEKEGEREEKKKKKEKEKKRAWGLSPWVAESSTP